MRIITKGNTVRLEVDPDEAIMFIAWLAETTNQANRIGSWSFEKGMPLRNEDLKRDLPGVLAICVSKEREGR